MRCAAPAHLTLLRLTAPKVGAFHDWNEDVETAEIFLPLPEGTKKKELVCSIHADKLIILHKPLGKTLLRAEPLAGLVVPAESTWYLQDEVLMIVLAKVFFSSRMPSYFAKGMLPCKKIILVDLHSNGVASTTPTSTGVALLLRREVPMNAT